MRLDRRSFLVGVGASAGWLATRGFGPRREPASFEETLRTLGASLTAGQRAYTVFPADHPSRQINNTLSVLRGPHLATLLSPAQLRLARDLYDSMLSERGREAFQGTIAVEGRLEGCTLAIYGEPAEAGAQAVISGGHVLVRGGAPRPAPRSAAASRTATRSATGSGASRVTPSLTTAMPSTASSPRSTPGAPRRDRRRAAARADAPGAGRGRPLHGPRAGRGLGTPRARPRASCSTPCSRLLSRAAPAGRPRLDRAQRRRRGAARQRLREPRLLFRHAELGLARCGRARAPRRSLLAGLAHRRPRHGDPLQGPSARPRLCRDRARPRAREPGRISRTHRDDPRGRADAAPARGCAPPRHRRAARLLRRAGARALLRGRGHHRARLRARPVRESRGRRDVRGPRALGAGARAAGRAVASRSSRTAATASPPPITSCSATTPTRLGAPLTVETGATLVRDALDRRDRARTSSPLRSPRLRSAPRP